MHHHEGTFQAGNGTDLYYQCWQPDLPASCILVIVHGFGEHSGRYMMVVDRLLSAGIAVYSYDNFGFGKSPGRRGHIANVACYRNALDNFITLVSELEPGRAIHLWGHSMGTLIVLDYCLHEPGKVKTLITSGAALEPAGVTRAWQVFLANVFSVLWPIFTLRLPVDPAALSNDPLEIADYKADPLVHNRCTARWGVSMRNSIAWIRQNLGRLTTPLLVAHGEMDAVNLKAGSLELFGKCASIDKKLVIYPHSLHTLHADSDRALFLSDLQAWIATHG